MGECFELSEDTLDKLEVVVRSSNLSDDSPPEKVVRTLANEWLIRNGTTEALADVRKEKEEAEAKRDVLREWIQGDGRGK